MARTSRGGGAGTDDGVFQDFARRNGVAAGRVEETRSAIHSPLPVKLGHVGPIPGIVAEALEWLDAPVSER